MLKRMYSEAEVSQHEKNIETALAKATTPAKAIRAHCVDCMGGELAQVRECTMLTCALFKYRMGRKDSKP